MNEFTFKIEGKECFFNRVKFKDAQDIEFAIKISIDENAKFDDKKRADDIICDKALHYVKINIKDKSQNNIIEYVDNYEILDNLFQNPYYMTIIKMKFLEYVMGFLQPLLNSQQARVKK